MYPRQKDVGQARAEISNLPWLTKGGTKPEILSETDSWVGKGAEMQEGEVACQWP